MSPVSRKTLLLFLFGKSIAEALLVTALAIGFYFWTTNPNLRGSVDCADAVTISGWALDEMKPGHRVAVQLFIDDKFVEQRVAADPRSDVRLAHLHDDKHGFVFWTPVLAPGEHEARVYAVHTGASASRRTLQLIGGPMRFRVQTVNQ